VRRVDRTILPSSRARLAALLAGVLGALSLALSAPAHAVVTEVGATKVGLQPRTEVLGEGEVGSFGNESGHPVVHQSNLFAIYWDPQNRFHHEWLTGIDNFLQRLGASSGEFGVALSALAQYRDRTNTGADYKTVFRGAYSDTAKYPAAGCADPNPAFTAKPITCLTDAQVREQLQAFISSRGLPKGMTSIFYVLTPPGVAVCMDAAATRCSDYKVSGPEALKEERNSASYKQSFCSYHAAVSPTNEEFGDGNTVLYAVIPWSAGTAGAGSGLAASQNVYKQAFDCQDGGWNPEEGEENREKAPEPSEAEQKAFEEASAEEKASIEKRRRLEGPRDQEPNQEGKGEEGDYAQALYDLIVNQIAIEQASTVTDPLLNAWQDSEGNEVADQCRNVFDSTAGKDGGSIAGAVGADEHTEAGTLSNTGMSSAELGGARYYLNNVLNLAGGGGCVGGVGLIARFTAPNTVNTNDAVTFDGMESTVSLLRGEAFAPTGPPSTTYATFSWNFGDGSPEVSGYAPGAPLCEAPWLSPCAASALHAYAGPGTYEVTLTATDVGGYVSQVSHTVTVVGPEPPPAEAGGGSPGGGSSAGGSSSSAVASGGAAGPGGSGGGPGPGAGSGAVAAPSATALIVSHSLRSALRNGLAVRYAVNEKVAGRFEVLLAKSAAKKIGLHAPLVTGLAQGTPAQTLIARSILVTTAGGRGQLRIHFSKTNAARLRKLRGATLMLRLVVRNPSNATATALATSKLGT